MYKIILASGSPRRQDILNQMGISFTAMPSNKEEISDKKDPTQLVQELSYIKAEDISNSVQEPAIIIGADTVVAMDGEILGKPKDHDDAYRMINKIQGREHQVHTGVTIFIKEQSSVRTIQFSEFTDVFVYSMTNEEIEQYINTEEPYDKAGAYAIQGGFAVHVQKIHGDYYNAIGFPIAKIYQRLCKEGIDILKI